MRKQRRPKTVLEAAVTRVGLRRAVTVVAFICQWGAWLDATPEFEGTRTIDAFTEWWRQARAKSFRDQKLFREAFPTEETPTAMWMRMRHQIEATSPNIEIKAAQLGALTWNV